MKRLLILAALAGLMTGCFRPADRTITVSVPQMKSQDCANRIVDAFKIGRPDAVVGALSAVPDLEKKTVTVTFKGREMGIKNAQFVIAGAGFDADEVKADPEARAALPEGCK